MSLAHFTAAAVTSPLSPVCPNGCGLPQSPSAQSTSAITNVLTIVFGVVGALALLMITVGGLRYITSAGDPQKASRARDTIIYAAVGIAIALTAEAIIAFVSKRLRGL